MNALSGDTPVFAQVDGKYGVYTLRELFELHKQGRAIKVPALLNEKGEKTWVEVEDVVSFGTQSLKRIMLSRSRLFVEVSEDAIIPAYTSWLFSGREKQIKLKFKHIKELKVTEYKRYNNDSILLTTRIPLNLPDGNQIEWDFGFALGFFVSEGSFHYRKYKNTKQSLAILNGFAKKKGMALQEYLNYMTDIKSVQLTIGQSDFERSYVNILRKHFKLMNPYKQKNANTYYLYSTDLSFIRLIKDYMEGHDSHTKHLKNEAFNRTKKFLEGIMDGFLAGDGSYIKTLDLFRVNITTNYRLYNDLIFLSKVLGYDAHINNGYLVKSLSSDKFYYALRLAIFKTYHRHTSLGLLKERIKMTEDIDEKEAFNLILKPIYTQDDKHVKFNHLYFTAFGIMVSDAVKTFTKLH